MSLPGGGGYPKPETTISECETELPTTPECYTEAPSTSKATPTPKGTPTPKTTAAPTKPGGGDDDYCDSLCCPSPNINLQNLKLTSQSLSDGATLSKTICEDYNKCKSEQVDREGLIALIRQLVNLILENLEDNFDVPPLNVLKNPILDAVKNLFNVVIDLVDCILLGDTDATSPGGCTACDKVTRTLESGATSTKDSNKCITTLTDLINRAFSLKCKVSTE